MTEQQTVVGAVSAQDCRECGICKTVAKATTQEQVRTAEAEFWVLAELLPEACGPIVLEAVNQAVMELPGTPSVKNRDRRVGRKTGHRG